MHIRIVKIALLTLFLFVVPSPSFYGQTVASAPPKSASTAGDASNFESSQVSLFYFSDVPRPMQALNSNVRTIGGVVEAQ